MTKTTSIDALAAHAAQTHKAYRAACRQYLTAERAFEKAERDRKQAYDEKAAAHAAFNAATKDPVP